MTRDELQAAYHAAGDALDEGEPAKAEAALAPVLGESARDLEAAECLAYALLLEGWSIEQRRAWAEPLLERWGGEPRVVLALAGGFEAFVDMRLLNAAPPSDPFSLRLLERAAEQFSRAEGQARAAAANALYSVARLSGRSADELCERAIRTELELTPSDSGAWYRYGLFLKTRGRFAEGVDANRRSIELAEERTQAMWWNLGICATGARDGQLALETWVKELGLKLELAKNGLPEGGFPHVKVQLVARPAASRTARDDSPGEAETVWIERLSPCHGRVLNPTYHDVAADFGDLVLFDGAPILSQGAEGRDVPVFPQLVTLERGGWSIHRFVARLADAETVKAINERLPADVTLYSHTDQVYFTCHECYLAGVGPDDCSHGRRQGESLTEGKLCVPPGMLLRDVDEALARAMAAVPDAWLLSPSFALALGDKARAAREQERLDGLLRKQSR